MSKTYRGSCHCGKIRFEADIDLSHGTTKCNCTFCWKSRLWGAHIRPDAFRLLAGDDALASSPGSTKTTGGRRCAACGIFCFFLGEASEWNDGDYVSINLAALDDLDPGELVAAPVSYLDGRADTWAPLEEHRHL